MPENKESVEAIELKNNKKIDKNEKLYDDASAFFDEIIEADEKIEKVYKPSKLKVILGNLIKPLFIYIAFVIAFVFLYIFPSKEMTQADSLLFLYVISGVFILIEIFMLMVSFKYLKNTYFLLTSKRIILSFGFFDIDFKTIDRNDIVDVFVKHNSLCFGVKNNVDNITFSNINDVKKIYNEIKGLLKVNYGKRSR